MILATIALIAVTLEIGANLNTLLIPLMAAIVLSVQAHAHANNKEKIKEIVHSQAEIHVLVNDRMSAAVERIQQLEAALKTSNTEVPPAAPPATVSQVRALTKVIEQTKPLTDQTLQVAEQTVEAATNATEAMAEVVALTPKPGS